MTPVKAKKRKKIEKLNWVNRGEYSAWISKHGREVDERLIELAKKIDEIIERLNEQG